MKYEVDENLDPPRTVGERVHSGFHSLFDWLMFLAGVLFILGVVFEIGAWALQLLHQGSWLALLGTFAAFLFVMFWLMHSIKKPIWRFLLLPIIVAFIAPFISQYVL